MSSDINPIDQIQQQLDSTANEIALLRDEIEAEDLDRYPNFEDRFLQFQRAMLDAEDTVLMITKLDTNNHSIDIDTLMSEIENTIDVVNQKLKRTNLNVLVSILNLLMALQGMLQELELGDDTSKRRTN